MDADVLRRLAALERLADQQKAIEAPDLSGTTFSATPFLNQRRFRTDRGLLYFWNGTLWLTEQEYTLPWSRIDTSAGLQPLANTERTVRGLLDQTYDTYLTRISARATVISGLNDGTNYWTAALEVLNASAVVVYTPATLTVNSLNTNFYASVNLSQRCNSASSTERFIRWSVTKTGTPGPIYSEVTVYYRLIG